MNIDLRLGDCLELMKTLPDGSVDLTVTSPPYDNLRTYGGYTWDFEGIAGQLYRVTKQGGVVVWVVGDETKDGSESGTSFHQALYFKELGFNLHDTMIYRKVAGATGSNYCYLQSFEYMFVLSNGKPNTINLLRDRKNKLPPTIVRWARGHRYRNGDTKPRREQVRREFGIRFNIWEVDAANGIDRSINHPAQFPEALATDHIKSWSNEGDVILDCFLGSGTTGVACVKLNRNFIGMEINPQYFEIAQRRIAGAQAQIPMELA